jgi:hypothetical protein
MDINIMELIQPTLIILIVVIYVLGMFLKKIPKVSDWIIPLVLLVVAVALTIIYKGIALEEGLNYVTIVNGIVYGILIAGVAVFGNQILKQVSKRE